MRPTPSTRLAALCLGLLYLLAWGEPVAWHPCPMHDGVAVAAAHGSDASHAAAHGGHAGHDAHAPAASDAGPADDAQEDHACQCLGHGCCPGGVLAPTAQAARWRVLVARRSEPPAHAPAARPADAAPRLLPFANAPPALA
jgi:hypothetical protein